MTGFLGPGSRLGRIEILGKLGAGGMADVWLGRIRGQGGFVRFVAVKTVHAELCRDSRARAMFLREAQVAASIRHANVVDVHDVGELEGILYQVMSLVEGDTFAALCRGSEPLPIGATISIVGDSLLGLHASHEALDETGSPRHLVHRDVSPHNILVGLDGVARVSDFGIARSFTATEDTTGSLRGKFAYFSPEQARQQPLDRRSDVFAMGIVLWEALTGARLFQHIVVVDALVAITSAPIPEPGEIVPSVPPALAAVTMRALEREPDRRYQCAQEMADALTRAGRDAGCLMPRPDVARVIEALIGADVRKRQAELVSGATAAPADAVLPTGLRVRAAPIVRSALDTSAIAGGDAAAGSSKTESTVAARPPSPASAVRSRKPLFALLALLAAGTAATRLWRAQAAPVAPSASPLPSAMPAASVALTASAGTSSSNTAAPDASAAARVPSVQAPPPRDRRAAPATEPTERRRAAPPRHEPFEENPFGGPPSR